MNANDGGNCTLSFAVLRSHSNDYEQPAMRSSARTPESCALKREGGELAALEVEEGRRHMRAGVAGRLGWAAGAAGEGIALKDLARLSQIFTGRPPGGAGGTYVPWSQGDLDGPLERPGGQVWGRLRIVIWGGNRVSESVIVGGRWSPDWRGRRLRAAPKIPLTLLMKVVILHSSRHRRQGLTAA